MSFPQAYALLIGIGTYADAPHLDVPITARDAAALGAVLVNPDLCAYPPDQVTVLHDAHAATADILSALDALADVESESTVLIFYSGHGDRGTDGVYYLTAHDTRLQGNRVEPGTGVSESDLLTKLRAIPAKRLLLVVNACHSGTVAPSLSGAAEQVPFGSRTLSPDTADAILATGEGRIIITACRPDQYSWVGDIDGPTTLFTRALLQGFRGEGLVAPRGGYVSAYDLYEQTYFGVKDAVAAMGQIQEPELTVLRGVGPFPVALYHGATQLGAFPAQQELPSETAARAVDPALSRRKLERRSDINATGSGNVTVGGSVSDSTIISGSHNTVQNAHGRNIAQASGGGSASVHDASNRTVDTGGGAYVKGNVNVGGGDFVGRDKIIDSTRHTAFDQRGQTVDTQLNVAGNDNEAAARDRAEALVQLRKLAGEIARAQAAGHLDEDIATDAEYQLKKAIHQAKKPAADKRAILNHLTQAQELLVDAGVGALSNAVTEAVQMIQRLY